MPSKAALIAPGQGSQRPRGLADQPASAREWFDRASALIGIDLWEAGSSWTEERLGRPSTLQPFLVAWAVADVERMRAMVPELGGLDYVLGHSSGQNSAMVLSGALSFDDGIRFAYERGKHLDLGCEAELGTLVALAGVDEELAREMGAAAGLQIANYNALDQFVLGGAERAVVVGVEWAARRSVAAVVLRVNGAFHTELFRRSDELSEPLIDTLPICESFTPLIGNAAGQIISTADGLRAELSQQYTRPIRWLDALQTAYDRGVRTFVVTGPGNAMAGLVRRFGKAQRERLRIVRLNAPSGEAN
ncbi:MAG: ACP S-malonyltransferase [Chloroflexi bacterium]|nr:ACP S-malonyltransferase [Chloroflexota bacterium]